MKIAIINSTGFWSMGWATDAKSQLSAISSLQRAGIEVVVHDVESLQQLEDVLDSLSGENCLVWPNAYHIYADPGKSQVVWLVDKIEEYGLPVIGNSASALKTMYAKDKCQERLAWCGVPIPRFAAIDRNTFDNLGAVLSGRHMDFPLMVKPNAASSSKGITQDNVTRDLPHLRTQIMTLGENHGYPVMVEEYLPNQDITVAAFMAPQKAVILATYYDTDAHQDPSAVLDYKLRLRDWNDGKWLRVVTEPGVLKQIEAAVLPACQATEVTDFTRIDCRFDQNGQLKIFDVNGMPGLELPFSTTVWQMIVAMQEAGQLLAYDTLIALILYCACHRHKMPVPPRISQLAQAYIEREESHPEGIAVSLGATGLQVCGIMPEPEVP